ncbi:SulP family inorganic anion transporter [Thiorhodococcus minor]|uniref:SulP family inorganic anion transporter n=1 Tax=Thiorhodococcus minor TaxID=57489 RepID=A0A6M0K3D1_9GAMM|nr:SulP family inorganic anion transporter [Thiorhodococcus minor]NEV64276.1 SulP family inorganic anion transporter [Thiorhodococcus minor]
MTQWIPLLGDLRHYQPAWLSHDLVAGLSVAAVQIPTAIAYANLAGFPPEAGLYASMLPVFVYALFGSSRQLVVGPDAATCAMIAALLLPLAGGDLDHYLRLSAGLAITAGLIMVVGGTTRMGFIVNFFARPILVGFLNGIAISIIVGQLGKLLGIAIENRDVGPAIVELVHRLGEVNVWSLALGLGTLALLIGAKRFAPRAPGALIALVAAGVAVYGLAMTRHGVQLIGEVPSGLPGFDLPRIGYEGFQGIFMGAIGLVIVSFTSGMLTARSFAARRGETINPDQEMRAIGFANVASGFFGGFAITGADSRTAVNDASGGKTQLVSVFAALATAVVALFLAAPLSALPVAGLAAVLIFSAWGLLDLAAYRQLWRIDRFELWLAGLTTLGVLTIGVLPGVVIAILLALINVLMRIYRPQDTLLGVVPGLDGYNDLAFSPEAKPVPGIIIYRFDAPLLFFNAEHFKSRLLSLVEQTTLRPTWVVLSTESITQLDSTGAQALKDIHGQLKARGVGLVVARPKLYMRKYGQAMRLGETIGQENIFFSIRAAVEAVMRRQGRGRDAGADA